MSIDDYYDISGKIGELYPTKNPEWPMFSYYRPGSILWSAIARTLHEAGWSDNKIRDWLQSKEPRWALDDALGKSLESLGADYARLEILKK